MVRVLTMDLPTTPLGLLRWIGFAQRRGADEWVRERDLSMEQGFVVGWLVDNPGSIQRDVARMTRTSAASVSSLLQGLERRGLIERRTEGGDERSKRVYATDAGADLVRGFETAMEQVDAQILAPLDAEEQETLRRLLTRVAEVLPEPGRS